MKTGHTLHVTPFKNPPHPERLNLADNGPKLGVFPYRHFIVSMKILKDNHVSLRRFFGAIFWSFETGKNKGMKSTSHC